MQSSDTALSGGVGVVVEHVLQTTIQQLASTRCHSQEFRRMSVVIARSSPMHDIGFRTLIGV